MRTKNPDGLQGLLLGTAACLFFFSSVCFPNSAYSLILYSYNPVWLNVCSGSPNQCYFTPLHPPKKKEKHPFQTDILECICIVTANCFVHRSVTLSPLLFYLPRWLICITNREEKAMTASKIFQFPNKGDDRNISYLPSCNSFCWELLLLFSQKSASENH